MNEASNIDPISITVRGARVIYAGDVLFESLDLTLPAGSWTTLLGPSGVGKTTLLRQIAGLGPPDATADIQTGTGAGLAGRVALMAQQDLLLPWRTVRDNVALGARLRGEPLDDGRIGDLLDSVGLADRATAFPSTLSGGERQRAALARTLYEDRPVVLMDEPFSALDALTRHRIQDLAARLLTDRTVLLITHDPMEALRVSDRIAVMVGRPARLEEARVPGGSPPRGLDAAGMTELQADLIARLTENGRRAA